MTELTHTPAERLAQLIASGATQDEALATLIAEAQPAVPTKKKGRAASEGLLPWSSRSGGQSHAEDRVTHELVRSEFERKCAERDIPPEVYNLWLPCVECDRFSVVDAGKKDQESGLVQAALNIDQMIDDKHQPIRTCSEFATSAFDMETNRKLHDELWADISAGMYPYLRVYYRRPDRTTRRHKYASDLHDVLLTTASQMDVDIVYTGVRGAPTSTFAEAYLSYWLPEFVKAEQASLVTRDRILDNTEPRARNGEVVTGAYTRAFGFTESEDGSIILTYEARWMEEAINRIALLNHVPYAVWQDMTARGMIGRPRRKSDGTLVPAGPIRFTSWLTMLSKPRWCAHRWFKADRDKRDDKKYKGILIPVNIPAVCTRTVWEFELLPKLNKGKHARNGEAMLDHELTRIGRCPCGSHLVSKGDYYVCAAKARSHGDPDLLANLARGAHSAIPAALFEATAETVLFEALDSPVLEETGAELVDGTTARAIETERTQLHAELATIELKLKRLSISIKAGSYDDDPAGAERDGKQLKLDRRDKSARLAQLAIEERPADRLDPEPVRTLWADASPKARNKVYDKVFDRIEVGPTRGGNYIRHEERLGFVFRGNYSPVELPALLTALADNRIAALKLAEKAGRQSRFTTRAVELYENGEQLSNQQITDKLIEEFGTSPRGAAITWMLVYNTLRRHFKGQGSTYIAHAERKFEVSLEVQRRLYQLRSGGHIWREVAELIELAARGNADLAHPKGPWTDHLARDAYHSYVRYSGVKPLDTGSPRFGRISEDTLARLDAMQTAGTSYQKLADYVTARGNYHSSRGKTVCNPGTVHYQLHAYRVRCNEKAAALVS